MNEKIKLDSGAMLELTMLDFETSMELFQAVSSELLKVNIDLGNLSLDDFTDSEVTKEMINTLKNVILTIIVSKDIKLVLHKAFERCTYNNLRITTETFENIKAREDYFPVCWEVLKFNLSPFLSRIGSLFMNGVQTVGLIRKQP